MIYKKYDYTYDLIISAGGKRVNPRYLQELYPDEKFVDEAIFHGFNLTFYSDKIKGTKEFNKELKRFRNPYLSYIMDNIEEFVEIFEDNNFSSPIEYVIDSISGCRCYGVGCYYLRDISTECQM